MLTLLCVPLNWWPTLFKFNIYFTLRPHLLWHEMGLKLLRVEIVEPYLQIRNRVRG